MKTLKAPIKDVVRLVVNNFRAALRERHIKRRASRLGEHQIEAHLRRLGISSGDVPFLNSPY
jgi:hypothetical protein